MPIKPENAALYPPDWKEIRAEVLDRARHKCEICGAPNHELGGRVDGVWLPAFPLGEKLLRLEWPKPGTIHYCGIEVGVIDGERKFVGGKARIIRIVLTIMHLDHDPTNNGEPGKRPNLKAGCQRCHLRYDARHHAQTAYATRRQGKAISDLFPTNQMEAACRQGQ